MITWNDENYDTKTKSINSIERLDLSYLTNPSYRNGSWEVFYPNESIVMPRHFSAMVSLNDDEFAILGGGDYPGTS